VTRGDDVFELDANQSTYIPVETMHRLENHGVGPLVLIEVQCGDYLGEDDIVRFDDKYGRVRAAEEPPQEAAIGGDATRPPRPGT